MKNNKEIISLIESDNINELSKYIEENNININEVIEEKTKRSYLHIAGKFNSIKTIKYLISKNADVENKDIDEATPIIVSAIRGSKESIRELVKAGADIDAKQIAGKTAAHMAYAIESKDTIELLYSLGANLNILDKSGMKVSEFIDVKNFRETKIMQDDSKPIKSEKENNKEEVKYENMSDEENKLLKELLELGFENITEEVKNGIAPVGRAKEIKEINDFIKKSNNIILVGEGGIGKTTMIRELAKELIKEDKQILQVPSSLLRGNKYAGSVNENIQKWIKKATKLYPKVILFIDEIHNLTTGKTSNDNADTPTQILKEYLDNVGGERIQIIGATTPKEYEVLKEADEAFVGKFMNGTNGGYEIQGITKEKMKEILKEESTKKIIEKQTNIEINKEEYNDKYNLLIEESTNLLDKYIFNQKFPYKGFEFIKTVLSLNKIEDIDSKKIEEEFGKKYSIPTELITGEITRESKFFEIKRKLNEGMLGQEEVVETISKTIIGNTAFRNPEDRKPISFLALGPTGVGKSETTELLHKVLEYPKIEYKLGEFKTPSDMNRLVDDLTEFIKKNYSGIIVFDEIEKANPQILDVLLGLLDKGKIGSGKNEVKCGNQIFIATSNIGVDMTISMKKASKGLHGTTSLPEDYLRGILVKEAMRPEIVNRFSNILDYNPIFLDVAIKIGKKIFEKRKEDIKKHHGVEIVFENSYIERQIQNNYNEESSKKNGARGIQRIVEQAFNKLIEHEEILLRKKEGTKITVSENKRKKEILVEIEMKNKEKSQFTIKEESMTQEEKFKAVLESMKELQNQASMVLNAQMINTEPKRKM